MGRLDGDGSGHVRLYDEPKANRGDAVVFRLSEVPHSSTPDASLR